MVVLARMDGRMLLVLNLERLIYMVSRFTFLMGDYLETWVKILFFKVAFVEGGLFFSLLRVIIFGDMT